MKDQDNILPSPSSRTEIDAFLRQVKAVTSAATGGGRLIFAMDATASREDSWDHAAHIQAEMFRETAALGGLEIQLCFFRGFNEFHVGSWTRDSSILLNTMTAVRCLAGHTQIERVLRHTLAEQQSAKVSALVYVGDAMEETADRLVSLAGALGLRGVPAFMFHEGGEVLAARTFREIARLSGGAYCPFDSGSARQLRELLSAVAVYAAGGERALAELAHTRQGFARQLIHQVRRED